MYTLDNYANIFNAVTKNTILAALSLVSYGERFQNKFSGAIYTVGSDVFVGLCKYATK